jgi:hypothetical protein
VVKIGFVVEGDCEKLLLESVAFQTWAQQNGIEVCYPVINARGGGNLCPKQLGGFVDACLTQAKPEKIVVLTDLECDPCVTATKQRIGTEGIDQICVAKKALESWFLADSQALQTWLGIADAEESDPELQTQPDKMPWLQLKEIAQQYAARGPGTSKLIFAKRMLFQYGFSLENAAAHPNCPSAAYFLNKLKGLAQA